MEDEIRRLFRMMQRRLWELRRELEEAYEYSFSRLTTPLVGGSIEPLHSMYEFPDEYVIVIDIPEADSSSVSVIVREDYLEIRAKMVTREAFESRFYSEVRREEASYVKRIVLPPDADPALMRYRVANGRLIINIPKRPFF